MKNFLKENIAIVAAITLPLLLVVAFIAAAGISTVTVEDPKHDFLLATNYKGYSRNAFEFNIIDDHMVVTYHYPQKNEHGSYTNTNKPQLWRVYVDDMSIEEISLPKPTDKRESDEKLSIDVNIPGVSGLKVVDRQPGPDGYRFETDYRYRGNIMSEIFFDSGSRRYDWVGITKDGRTIGIQGPEGNRRYNRYNTEFIGWIIDDE